MGYLVIQGVGGSVPKEIRLNGGEASVEREDDFVSIVEIPDNEEVELEIGPPGEAVLVGPELVSGYAGEHAATAQPLRLLFGPMPQSVRPVLPHVLHAPRQSTFISRVNEGHAKPLAEHADVAGTPEGTGIPVNYVGEKLTCSYLSTHQPPLYTEPFVYGELRQFDTYWEPLGWALDEWISTLSLAPFEDTVESNITLASHGQADRTGVTEVVDALRAHAASAVSATEVMELAASASVASRGWGLGIEGPSDAVSPNPIEALARGVLGTFQFDFGSARTATNGAINTDLRQDIVSRLQQATARQRATSNWSLATSASALGESRRLRAIRNLGPGKSENLALYSIVRQWLVSTVEGPRRRILLIKVHELDKRFDRRDVFLHRAVLSDGLLDPNLQDDLDQVATNYKPDGSSGPGHAPRSADPSQHGPAEAQGSAGQARDKAHEVTGKLVVTDPARGKGSTIEISALFRAFGKSEERQHSQSIEAPNTDTVEFKIPLQGEPLDDLIGWKFEFHNPGWLNLDVNARFSPVEVEIHLEKQEMTKRVDLPTVHVWPGYPKVYERGIARPDSTKPSPEESDQLPLEARRLLEHLEAYRAYYRLLIDLRMDPVTRFDHLSRRWPPVPMPADLQPVGIAGTHLAFLTADDSPSPNDDTLPIKEILSTPAGGTFVEVLQGQNENTQAAEIKNFPTVALPPNGTVPWPAPIEAPFVEADKSTESGEVPQLSQPPEKPELTIADKLTGVLETLDKLKTTVEGMKAEWPKRAEKESKGTAKPASDEGGEQGKSPTKEEGGENGNQ